MLQNILLSSSLLMSASLSSRPAGTPSMTTPIALPWLSPNVAILSSLPKNDMYRDASSLNSFLQK
jgi:hypothetical protein